MVLNFFYSGFILIFKDVVLMSVHGTKCFTIFRLFTEAACESQVASFTYLLHKRLPFSRLRIPWRILRGRI